MSLNAAPRKKSKFPWVPVAWAVGAAVVLGGGGYMLFKPKAPKDPYRTEQVTRGDVTPGDLAAAGGKGLFTQELEAGLLAGRLDLAVHSLKDLPVTLPEGLAVAAFPERADPRDALVSAAAASLGELPAGAVVLTGSLRRRAQLLALRPDLVRPHAGLEPVLVPLERLTAGSALREGRGLGYFGDPSLASRERGERYLDFIVERALPDVRAFLDGAAVPGLPLRWRLGLSALSIVSRVRDALQTALGNGARPA